MIGAFRLFYRGLFSLGCVLLITVLMSVTWNLGFRRATRTIMQTAFRVSAFVWGIRIRVQGHQARARPLIIVSNHFSYLDLFVLGSIVPAAFTPKIEIRSWPVLGFMARVSGCLFIDRRAARTLENKQRLEKALAAGDVISLFPEGTTNDGAGLLPFKSAFFGLAQETGAQVQPVSILYTRLNGKPLNSATLPLVGWYGDMLFFPHVVKYLQQRRLDALLVFHPILDASAFPSRKALALYCSEVVESGLRQ